MIPAEIIKKKRAGFELTSLEIRNFISSYLTGEVADYQMSALLMAVYFQGMTKKETWALTEAMLHSGSVVDFKDGVFKIDKHSTGGVGDKTSLIITPLVAACGVPVPMISGRGLGHTGGTLDKLESIPGFNVNFDLDSFKKLVLSAGACFIGQTKEICPADKRMYALRDVTGTVESIPLICASIMSKKLAEGIDGLVLDVKTGSGAFMKKQKDSINLARALIEVGKQGGKKVVALISDMSQPLGNAVGNSLEVSECLEILKGQGPQDLRILSLELSAHMVLLSKKSKDLVTARKLVTQKLDNGEALKKFEEIVKLQGGHINSIPHAEKTQKILSPKSGFIKTLNAEQIGLASLALGAGRLKADSKIDPSAGIVIHKKIGDFVKKGEPLATLYYNGSKDTASSTHMVKNAYSFYSKKVPRPRLILKVLK